MLHLFGVLSGGNIAFLREEGGTRQGFPEANEMSFGGSLRCVTEGDRATLGFRKFHFIALSLSRFATAFGPGRKHGLLPALAKNMPPAYFLNASRPPGGSLRMRATLGVWALPMLL